MKALTTMLLLFTLCTVSIAETITSPNITYVASRTNANTITFTANDLKELDSNKYGTAYYDYFWKFGDGGFSFEESPTYTFKTTTTSINVTLELTQIYSDDEIEELGKMVTITGGSADPVTENPQVIMEHDDGSPALVVLQGNRDPVEGNDVTFIVTYEENISLGDFNGVEFTYDTGDYTYDSEDTFNGESIHSRSPGKVILNVTPGTQKHIYYILTTATGISGTTTVQARAVMINPVDIVPVDDTDVLTTKTVGKSYDPNQKVVDKKEICIGKSTKPVRLKYRIDFENIGTAPADYIRIEDELSNYLNPNSVFKGCTPGKPCPARTAGRWADGKVHKAIVYKKGNKIIWEFEGDKLIRGKAEDGCGTEFSEADCQGFVGFGVQTRVPARLPDCTLIINSAKIFFDRNEPITTAPVTTLIKKNCEFQNACLEDGGKQLSVFIDGDVSGSSFTEASTVAFETGESINLQVNFETALPPSLKVISETYEWYPTTGLSDAYSAKTTATPTETTTYMVMMVVAAQRRDGRISNLLKTKSITLRKE